LNEFPYISFQVSEKLSELKPDENSDRVLSPKGKEQVKRGCRKCDNRDIRVLHNKDELICSYENKLLARWTVHISRQFNEKVKSQNDGNPIILK
jgi:hypothetical protein